MSSKLLDPVLLQTDFPDLQLHASGKVRDVYQLDNERLLFVATDRISAFDYVLAIDDAAYYCVEMTEKAYRAGGMALSEPVRLGDMENIARYPVCVFVFLKISNLSLDQLVYFPGNDHHGIWSCPRLMTVYESKPTADVKMGWFHP